jgi:hypothetical protein
MAAQTFSQASTKANISPIVASPRRNRVGIQMAKDIAGAPKTVGVKSNGHAALA